MVSAANWPAIGDYALIGDCRTAALVASDGAVEWLCLPDFDSPAFFAAILDREKGGSLRTTPGAITARRRRYLDRTNILETTLESEAGTIQLTDFLVIGEHRNLLQPEREMLRIVEAIAGEPEVELRFDPAPNYARDSVRLNRRGKLGWSVGIHGSQYLLRSDIELERRGPARLAGRVRLAKGERRTVSLSYVAREPAAIPLLGEEALEKLETAKNWWRDWCSQCTYDGPFRQHVIRSALALKSLQFCISGAVMAAASCSLPEAIGGARNWDYRYCWLRDAAFTLQAFMDTGFRDEAETFFNWLMHATGLSHPKLRPLYDVYGRIWMRERTLDGLAGYRNSTPVRIGNAAKDHLQLDVYGSIVAAAAIYLNRGYELRRSEKQLLTRVGKAACDLWRQPDNGFWEYRRGRRHNTWSKVMCWACLDNLIKLHDEGTIKVPREKFAAERAKIAQAIERQAYDPAEGNWVGAFGEDFMDATLLLLPAAQFVDARDPRMMATWQRISRELESRDGLIRRYSQGTDALHGREGVFVICSFWAVAYLARAGQIDEARRRMERLLSYANEVGLYAEEIDPYDGSMLGNFPQAFSHSGLIHAALAIRDAERRARR